MQWAGSDIVVILHNYGICYKSASLTSQEMELMDNYRKLTDEGRKIISVNVKLLAKK